MPRAVNARSAAATRSRGVAIPSLDPHVMMIGTQSIELLQRQRRGAGEDEGTGKRQRALAEPLYQAVAVAVERARRPVHDDGAIALQRHELLGRERPLTHVQVQLRHRDPPLLDFALAGL